MNPIKILDQYGPPTIEEQWKKSYWSIPEAVFALTHWPKGTFIKIFVKIVSKDKEEKETYFFLPALNKEFDPMKYEKKIQNIFSQIKKAIKDGHFSITDAYFKDGFTYLLCPEDVILWALYKEMSLPYELQRAANVYQILGRKTTNPKKTKIRRKIVAQFILAKKPFANISEISRDDLMMRLGCLDKTTDKEQKAVKRAIGQLFNETGKPERSSNSSEKGRKWPYISSAIPEIMQRDSKGTVHYHFPYLICALETAARAIIGNDIDGKKCISDLFLEFYQNYIVRLYLPEPSELLIKFVRKIVGRVITEYLSFRPLIERIHRLAAEGVHVEFPLIYENCRLEFLGKICLF